MKHGVASMQERALTDGLCIWPLKGHEKATVMYIKAVMGKLVLRFMGLLRICTHWS